MDDFAAFMGFRFISAAFGGRKSRKSKGPWKWLPEKERANIAKWTILLLLWCSPHFGSLRILQNGRFCCFCEIPLISAPLAARNPENVRGPGNGFRKRSEYCEMGDFAAFMVFRFISAAFGGRKSRKSKGPGNGFRKRSEYCEMDDFAAFVVFPSFRQLSTAGNPENPRGPGNGFRKWSEYCKMADFAAFVSFLHFGTFGGRKSRKCKGPWKWLPEKERILRNGRFCCFCVVPLTPAAFGGRKSRKSKGPWKWLPERERILRNGRFCCFCGVPLISAAFAGRKSRESKGPWKWLPEKEGNIAKWTILLLLWCSPHFGSFRRPEIQKI